MPRNALLLSPERMTGGRAGTLLAYDCLAASLAEQTDFALGSSNDSTFAEAGDSMGLKGWNVAILVAIGAIWFAGSTQREKRVVGDAHTDKVAAFEDQAAASPADPVRVKELAQSYLDAHQPGMALLTIERAPEAVRKDASVEHLYARSLLDQGRSADALAAERRVLSYCADPTLEVPACSTYLIASATRRAEILEQLVNLGIEDANAHPEASSLAYHNATRQVSFSSR